MYSLDAENMSKDETLKNLYRELGKVKAAAKGRYNEGDIRIDPADVEKRRAQSQHLVSFDNLKIDKVWLEELFGEYLSALKRFADDREAVSELEQGFGREELDLETLVRNVFRGDSDYLDTLALKLGLKTEDLFCWGLRLGTPVFELHAEKLRGKTDPDTWSKGYCPVCGSPPAMAYLRHDDGKRILWCQFCGSEWSYLRLKCPFCHNDNQDTLRYFFSEEQDAYRVYVCDKCKRYIKTVDQRKLSDHENLDLEWENLKSLALDVLAQNDGYMTHPARVRA